MKATPSPGPDRRQSADDVPEAVAVRRGRVSAVWLIPLVALVAAGWLAYKTYSEQGPQVQIELKTAAGLQAGKTKVKFKEVEVGQVTAISLAADLKTVVVTAQLTQGAESYLTDRTRFWVERPRVTASRVSGLDTLLSGAYIAVDPVTEGRRTYSFVGLDEPPLFTTSEPGKRFMLRSTTTGSLNVGSPVYYRQIQVGQVVGNTLSDDGGAVTVEVFVSAPHDRLVNKGTRFWNSSGIDFSLSAEGLKVDTQSLLSVLLGGVSFDTPQTIDGAKEPAEPDQVFWLYPSRDEAHEKIYQRKERYLLFFEGSVRGLSVGAPVLLRGIVVGRVLDVQLTFSLDDFQFQIPVLIEVEPERIGVRGNADGLSAEDVVRRLVERGLRAQLGSGNLLTGQLYVELDFHPEAPSEALGHYGDYQVLPTVPAALEALATRAAGVLAQAEGILSKVDGLPFERVGREIEETVAGANGVVNSAELKSAIAEVADGLAAVRATAERIDREIVPELSTALRQTTRTLAATGDLVAESSPAYIELQRMFQDVSAAARSLRTMADYLERHPEALLKGKGGGR